MKRHNEGGADADRLTRCAAQILSAQFHDVSGQSRYRVSRAILLENGASALEFLKFYGAAFCGSMFRKTARRAAMRLLDTQRYGSTF